MPQRTTRRNHMTDITTTETAFPSRVIALVRAYVEHDFTSLPVGLEAENMAVGLTAIAADLVVKLAAAGGVTPQELLDKYVRAAEEYSRAVQGGEG
jgi:hypothetical protein